MVTLNSVVKLAYTDAVQETLTTVLMGYTLGLPVGLEAALLGRQAGERFLTDLKGPPIDPELVQVINRDELPTEVQVGDVLYGADDSGKPRRYRVIRLGDLQAEIDGNPENAGCNSEVEVHVLSVRAPTAEELDHGHIHGEGGHSH